jgi:hypothetical protein
MKQFIESLEDFTWENYKTISDALVTFDDSNIELEMQRQATIYSYYHALMSLAKKTVNDIEADNVRSLQRFVPLIGTILKLAIS